MEAVLQAARIEDLVVVVTCQVATQGTYEHVDIACVRVVGPAPGESAEQLDPIKELEGRLAVSRNLVCASIRLVHAVRDADLGDRSAR
jgi:hypothetical protein